MKHPALETEQFQKEMGCGLREYKVGYLGSEKVEYFTIRCHSYDYSLYRFHKKYPYEEPVSVTWTEIE